MNLLPQVVAATSLLYSHQNHNDGMCCSYYGNESSAYANKSVDNDALNKLQLLSVLFGVQSKPSAALSSRKPLSLLSPMIGSFAHHETCPPGWYMGEHIEQEINQTSKSMCQPCPTGTFNRAYGATSIDWCFECSPGRYNNQTGKLPIR